MPTKEELHSRPELSAYIIDRNCEKLAEILSEERTQFVTCLINEGTVMDALGADEGAALLDALKVLAEASPALRYGLELLEKTKLDIGLVSVREQFEKLALAGQLPTHAVTTLVNLAKVRHPFTIREVAEILYNDDGSLK